MHGRSDAAQGPQRLEVVGDFLALKWPEGSETILELEGLRRACPCARCSGEPDVTGAVRMPAQSPVYSARSFEVIGLERVGQYAVSIRWGDGHDTGIYSWPLLRELGAVGGGSEGHRDL